MFEHTNIPRNSISNLLTWKYMPSRNVSQTFPMHCSKLELCKISPFTLLAWNLSESMHYGNRCQTLIPSPDGGLSCTVKLYLSWFQNVFSKLSNAFVQIAKCISLGREQHWSHHHLVAWAALKGVTLHCIKLYLS